MRHRLYFNYARDTPFRLVRSIQLPMYMNPPAAGETVVELPWIQYGGDLFSISAVPQVGAATFGPHGRLYAVRTYRAEWHEGHSSLLKGAGQWLVTDDDLEIYDAGGRLLGAYEVPGDGIDWLRVDDNKRIIMHVGKRVLVVKDPVADVGNSRSCPTLPAHISIPTIDRPPLVPIDS